MIRIWGTVKKRQRIEQQETVEANSAAQEDIHEAVGALCKAFDIARPIWMEKHENEMERFGRTVFLPEHFIESVNFDRFEVEILRERTRSRDPRNDFSSY